MRTSFSLRHPSVLVILRRNFMVLEMTVTVGFILVLRKPSDNNPLYHQGGIDAHFLFNLLISVINIIHSLFFRIREADSEFCIAFSMHGKNCYMMWH